MHFDIRELEGGSTIEGDLCIAGAGAAGIALALEWIGRTERVILLEGGGFEFEPAMQDLYRGANIGQPYYPLHAARLRFFGGSTGHWGGFCAPLDPVDFEVRSWVPHSGWPFARAELDPYYVRANHVLELTPHGYDIADWQARDPDVRTLPARSDMVWTKLWQFSPPTRFGLRYRRDIVDARNVHLYTYASVCEIEVNEAVQSVEGLRIRTLEGKEFRARASRYVLACSTMENTRLLLASNRRAAAGLGNAHDLVGRFFMEHLEMPAGKLAFLEPQPYPLRTYSFLWGTTKMRGELALSAATQRKTRILNGTAAIEPLRETLTSTFQELPPELLEQWTREEFNTKEQATAAAGAPEPPPSTITSSAPERFFELFMRQEQAPNPDSRLTLATERDALGVPRVKLDWRLTELDRRTFSVFFETLGREMGRTGTGRVQLLEWVRSGTDWPPFLSGGWHHMGTTRMHPDPRRGVVDANCRVHGLSNLFIASASVYPTGGAANPTLTLIAMVLRLSDHLKTGA